MSLRVFISSRMDSSLDSNHRRAVVEELRELGHEPVFFENLAARPLLKGQRTEEKCRELVRGSELVVCIVDDTITPGMRAELEEATEHLGEDHIIYYFTAGKTRDSTSEKLWNKVKESHIVALFSSDEELRLAVRRSLASYIESIRSPPKSSTPQKFECEIDLRPGSTWHRLFEFEEGDEVTVTITADEPVYCTLATREQFARLKAGTEDFDWFTDKRGWTGRATVGEDDDYYLVVRRTVWGDGASVGIRVKWKKLARD